MKKVYVGIGVLSLLFTLVQGQTPEELFDIARSTNAQVKALRQMNQAAYSRISQMGRLPNLELGVGAFVAPVETRLGPQVGRFSASQMFPWFGTLQARENQAKMEAEASFEQIALWEWEIRYQLERAYYSLYELETSQDLIQENLQLLGSLKEVTEAKVANGIASLADVLRIDLDLQGYAKEMEILEAKKRKLLIQINQLLNRSFDTPIQIDSGLSFNSLSFNQDSLLVAIHSKHPQLRTLGIQQEASRAAIQLNEKEAKPAFGIGLDYLWVDAREDVFPTNNGRDAIQLKAMFSLPLSRNTYRAKEQEERFKIEAFENQKEELSSRFVSLIEQALADYESARLMYELYTQQIETTQAAIRILETAYSNEGKSFEELLDLERVLLEYELKRLNAIVMSYMARAEIGRYVGISVASP